MTLIEGIGDEVTHFFIALLAVIIVTLAWWTTNISEQRHVRTVLLLERRRHRAHRRLTNHTETVTITEGSSIVPPIVEEPPITVSATTEPVPSDHISHEASTSNESAPVPDPPENLDRGEEQNIIETMDADACVLRQRRLAFYNNWTSTNRDGNDESPGSETTDPSRNQDRIETILDSSEHTVMEHNYAEQDTTSTSLNDRNEQSSENNERSIPSDNKPAITIKLKYINDDLKLVDGRLEEMLGDFKKRHFQTELSSNKLVRLIFNGRVLRPDTQTLKSCGLFDNCVVHCLIHQKRAQAIENASSETARDGYSFPSSAGINNINNNNQNRDWDLGNFLFAFISFILLAAWYFRYVYAHLYTVTATVGLILITGIFTIVLVGMYFPDNPDLPAPPIRFARERVQPQQ
ncbi:transmembrane and ubiquitin-like domain-containing protein 1 isoform X2 [Anoplophora glabripennis]|uniref:transmembrane and ubiquitin-like domain-containing protein 1 isoform X2 n=1 Tax=Anoplophora glabripennis TaxID=217634 RepID=UPI000874C94D|nr:transmembrane and ubiquitin-like domain-containing protein 1 isoform X2 [Anoplophora glabripennis]